MQLIDSLNAFQFRETDGKPQYKLESEGADSWRFFNRGAIYEVDDLNKPSMTSYTYTADANYDEITLIVLRQGIYSATFVSINDVECVNATTYDASKVIPIASLESNRGDSSICSYVFCKILNIAKDDEIKITCGVYSGMANNSIRIYG